MELPDRNLFDLALKQANVKDPKAAYHIGSDIESELVGCTSAGWNALRYNEWFDEEFPDWFEVDDFESADEGAKNRRLLMEWGRKDVSKTDLSWIELWGQDEVLYLFGFPEDPSKPLKTTYVKNIRGDY